MFIFTFLAAICLFQPPENWESVDKENLSNTILAGFYGKRENHAPPTLNLALEKTSLSLKDYVKAVKDIHEQELHIKWRDLGQFTFKAGKGRLGEIVNPTPLGEMKMLQGIFIKDGYAYILTGASLKEEFSEHRKTIIQAIRSLNLVSDLFAAIDDSAKQQSLKERFEAFHALKTDPSRKYEWESLKKTLPKEFTELGAYWSYLALEEGFRRIFSSEAGQKDSSL